MKTLIIGLGNPILRDDGAGIHAARILRKRIGAAADIDVAELSVGGVRLMEEMAGYDRVFLIDAMITGKNRPGAISRLDPGGPDTALHASSAHDATLACALESGRKLGIRLPSNITVWGIEAGDVNTFGEQMTPAVASAARQVVQKVLEEL